MKTLLFFTAWLVVASGITGFRIVEPEPLAEAPAGYVGQPAGELLYKQNCMRCHGADGTRGLLGARNLRKSVLNDSAVRTKILSGKGFMPSFRKKFGEPELEVLVAYVKSLRAE